jgi:hypothetical protein
MWYVLLGLFLGSFLTLIPVWMPSGAAALTGEWHGTLKSVADVQRSNDRAVKSAVFASIVVDDTLLTLSGNGALLNKIAVPGKLLSGSGSGKFYTVFERTGSHVELYGARGARFWRIPSAEYPYLSYNGELVLFINADMSEVRLFDHNGNPVGVKNVAGRFITSFAFARGSDHAVLGFLDGSWAVINKSGEITARGTTPDGTLVKSVALSDDGAFAAVHYGGEKGDHVLIVNTASQGDKRADLSRAHVARIAMHVRPDGKLAVLDGGRIVLFSKRGNVNRIIQVPREKSGIASIAFDGSVYAAAYPREDGDSQLIVFTEEGEVLLSKICAGESFLTAMMDGRLILARGSQGLYCYRIRVPEPR